MTHVMRQCFCCMYVCDTVCLGCCWPQFCCAQWGPYYRELNCPSFIRSIIAIRSQLTNTIKGRGGMWDYRFNEPFVQANYMWMRVCRSSCTPYIYHRWTPNKPHTHIQRKKHNVNGICNDKYCNWFVFQCTLF